MFELVGYILSILILCVGVTLLVELLKKLPFILSINKWFTEKIKRISFYQLLTFIVSIVLLVVLGWFGAITLTFIQIILNAVLITFAANGVYTWYLKIFSKIQPLTK